MVLDCALEVSFLGFLGGMVVRAILVGSGWEGLLCTILYMPRVAGFR